jgi:nicotinamide-nucleotide amidase
MTRLSRAAIFSIGTELTRGEIDNTNASWLAERLTAIGLDVSCIESVPDDPVAITQALERLSQANVLVVSTGGLGPTTDDITSATVASWLGVGRVRDLAVIEALRERLAKVGRQLTASNSQQADFPEGATILDNPHGTAPGFAVSRGSSRLFFMPGVPREMRAMFETHVEPVARGLVQGAQHQIRLRCFGAPESVLNDKLAGLEAAHGIQIGYRAHFPEVQVKLLALAATPEAAAAKAAAAAVDARARLGSAVYAEGESELPRALGDILRERKLTLGLAESCTGGLVGSLLTRHAGSSEFLLGGVISYSNQVKHTQLGVPAPLLEANGAVSPEVARAMAEGALELFGSDLALSLTGIAGPGGATPGKPVGLVYYALATSTGTIVRDITLSGRPRESVQLYSAWCGLDLIRQQVLGLVSA